MNSLWIGFDPREAAAFAIARETCRKHLTLPIPIYGLVLEDLQKAGLYTRPIEYRPSAADKPVMWDVVSDAPMSTQHACARFLIRLLAKSGWALFVDGDVMFRGNVGRLFYQFDNSKAVYCVKHNYSPALGLKMDGMIQTAYPKKNWSSVMAINCDHPSNAALTAEYVNSTPGRKLHAFSWLKEDEIGELGPEWNYLVGESQIVEDPKIVHFTLGLPDMPGYTNCEFADEWREQLAAWAR